MMASTVPMPPAESPSPSPHDEETIHGFLRFLTIFGMTPEKAERTYFRPPVDVATFINSPVYMNKSGTVYPVVMDELVKCNSGRYVEGVFTGGIGSGKTTAAL